MTEFASGTERSISLVSARVPERFALMRLFRLFVLVLSVGAVALGQFLLMDSGGDRDARMGALPDWLPPLLSTLGLPYQRILAQPPATAYWLLLLGMLTFAVIAPWWGGEQGQRYRPLPSGAMRVGWGTRLAWGGALVSSMAAGWQASATDGLPWLWAAALVLYGLACGLTARAWTSVIYADDYKAQVAPHKSRSFLVALLGVFALLLFLPNSDTLLRVDESSAQAALVAQQWLSGASPSFFSQQAELPALPLLLPFIVFLAVVPDGVMALRLTGIFMALALLTSVWLLACELFRRSPRLGEYGEVLEDDGRWLALLAVLATGVTVPYFAAVQQPLLPAGTVLGVFALWALLRGLRVDRPAWVGVGGLLSGLALYAGLPGLWLLLMALLVWLGVYLLMREWLTGRTETRRNGEPVVVQRGLGMAGLGLWGAGIVVAASPLLGLAITRPERFWAHWRWSETETVVLSVPAQLQAALLGLFQVADRSGLGPSGAPYVQELMAILVVLALGALLLNLDSLVGWVLVTWLGVGLLGMSLAVPTLPDWAAYLPILPALGLAVAFGLDRLRVVLMSTLGTWTLQATVYLALGLLLISGFFGWIDYATHRRSDVDLASVVGHVLAQRQDVPVALVSGAVAMQDVADSATVRLLAGRAADGVLVVGVDSAAQLPAQTRLLFAPADWYLAWQVVDAAPGRSVTILRDRRANPLLYVVE